MAEEKSVGRSPTSEDDTFGLIKDVFAEFGTRPTWKAVELILRIVEQAGFTPEVRRLVPQLAREAGLPPDETLIQAIGLYRIALDATKEGHRLVVVDPEDTIVQEIEEIVPKGEAVHATAPAAG